MHTSTAVAGARPLAVPLWRELAPLCLMVFLEFLAMGLPLAVLPVHVHDTLGFGSFVVGLAIGLQSVVTLLTRHAAVARRPRVEVRHPQPGERRQQPARDGRRRCVPSPRRRRRGA